MKPSSTELLILRHLWSQGTQSVGEIHRAVADELEWSRSSTRKTVERMVDKRLLSMGEQHGVKVYRAKVKKVPTLASMIRSFAADVLGLDGPLPVSSLVNSKILDDKELAELEELLGETMSDQSEASGGEETGND
ncbi:MAG: BlaI/MecI/CopY family transcriptional regulator [Pseudomonadota bacterium]